MVQELGWVHTLLRVWSRMRMNRLASSCELTSHQRDENILTFTIFTLDSRGLESYVESGLSSNHGYRLPGLASLSASPLSPQAPRGWLLCQVALGSSGAALASRIASGAEGAGGGEGRVEKRCFVGRWWRKMAIEYKWWGWDWDLRLLQNFKHFFKVWWLFCIVNRC